MAKRGGAILAPRPAWYIGPMHTVLRQVEFRLVAPLLMAILVPVAGFIWWRLGLDVHAMALKGWRQQTRAKFFGPSKPELFYTDEKGRLRRVQSPWAKAYWRIMGALPVMFGVMVAIPLLDMASRSHRPIITSIVVVFGLGGLISLIYLSFLAEREN
jgi:hypothetical protein